jgi:phage tail-like protein
MSDLVQEPTFVPLDGRLGWRTGSSAQISVGAVLQLAAAPDGPLGLAWRDGSLGGLTLPRGMALDAAGTLYLLAPRRLWTISAFNRATGQFAPLPGMGGAGTAPRRFRRPQGIAIGERRLYIADMGNRRVQVFDLPTLTLLYLWTLPRRPIDAVAQGNVAYVLDSRRRIYRHTAGTDDLRLVIDGSAMPGRWRRLALDQAGRIYVLDHADTARLLMFHPGDHSEPQHDAAEIIADAGAVRERFAPPAIRLRFDQRHPERSFFRLPMSLTRPCPVPEAAPPPAGRQHAEALFDRAGRRVHVDPAEVIEPRLYATTGEWISRPLDSTIFGCQWHRVELELDQLPAGTSVCIQTFSADDEFTPLPAANAPLWQQGYRAVGAVQPPPGDPAGQTVPQPPNDFLVQSRQGQYLRLRITLHSDGFATPRLRGLRLHFPRESYLAYLPAVYAADETNRWFLERYLSLFQTDWDALERVIAAGSAYADPDAVPAGPALDALAQRFGLPIEREWRAEERRVLLQQLRAFYRERGTVAGLRAYLRAYLQKLSGLPPAEQGAFPLIAEGWRERPRPDLPATGGTAGAGLLQLWGAAAVGRLQLGATARVGAARLVDHGDPQRDLFRAYAHRFRVYVPAAWIADAAAERMLQRAIAAEKPAHVAHELRLVEARLRVGVQSTVGVDTILGAYPQARLSCADAEAQRAPGRAPRSRLGYDTVLADARGAAPEVVLTVERNRI